MERRNAIGLGRKLDFVPAPVAIAMGGGLGLGLGLVAAGMPLWISGLVYLALAAVGVGLAVRGQTIVVRTQPKPVKGDVTGDVKGDAQDDDIDEAVDESRPEICVGQERRIDPLAMVEVRSGRFVMGGDRYTQRTVELSGFQCMAYPVTRGLYAEVMGVDPAWPEDGEPEQPVNQVSWLDAVKFCNRLSIHEGLTPCYELGEEPDEEVTWDHSADGYRLPTEAEWEYACRAGTQTGWSFGDDEALLGEYAWYDKNAAGTPHPVGEKKPNAWGLHDMHGNVWEWCWDWYSPYPDLPPSKPDQNPTGPSTGHAKALRGGAFFFRAGLLRCALRFKNHPSGRGWDSGFRCIRVSGRQR